MPLKMSPHVQTCAHHTLPFIASVATALGPSDDGLTRPPLVIFASRLGGSERVHLPRRVGHVLLARVFHGYNTDCQMPSRLGREESQKL